MFLPTMLDCSECRDPYSGFIFVQLIIYEKSTESSVVEIARVNQVRPNEETIQCTYISFLCFPNIAGTKVLMDIKVCPIEKSVDWWISGPIKLVDRRNIHPFCLAWQGVHMDQEGFLTGRNIEVEWDISKRRKQEEHIDCDVVNNFMKSPGFQEIHPKLLQPFVHNYKQEVDLR